ncbi:hypothetical protein L6V77_06230 [Myxococcota bacterium]|nr:hypothetical protein [Myxococcota bacterium]
MRATHPQVLTTSFTREGPARAPWRIIAAAALVLALGYAALMFLMTAVTPDGGTPPPPRARIFVLVERTDAQHDRLDDRTIVTGDVLHVAVVAEPTVYTNLLNLDSRADFTHLGETWDERPRASDKPLTRRFEVDAITGRETLVVVAARRPIGDQSALLAEINGLPDLSRADRLELLEARLQAAYGAHDIALHASQELVHLD